MTSNLKRNYLSMAIILGMATTGAVIFPDVLTQSAYASNKNTSNSQNQAYYIGDSIAVGAAVQNGSYRGNSTYATNTSGRQSKIRMGSVGVNQAVEGTPPAGVLFYINTHAHKLRGKKVVLSTGATNSGDMLNGKLSKDLSTIENQLKALKNAGAEVYVMGVANNMDYSYNGKRTPAATGMAVNAQLKQLAQRYGFTFLGGFVAHDGKHARNYRTGIRSAGSIDSAPTPTTQQTPVVVNNPNSGMSDEQIQAYFKQHGRRPGLNDLIFPNDNFTHSQARFGGSYGNVPHTGIDLYGPGEKQLKAGDSGVVNYVSSSVDNSAGNYISVQRDNQGKDTNLKHSYRYLHMKQTPSQRLNQKISLGEVLGVEGKSGRGVTDVHLQIDYVVPKGEARNVFLNDNTGRYKIDGVSIAGNWQGGVYTDPTPYYGKDVEYKTDKYTPYLGSTWRWQFNTLYGTQLPTKPGSQGPTKQIPNTVLNQLQDAYDAGKRLTPDEMAAIRQSMANASVIADEAGYSLSGQWVSQRTLASFLSLEDGADFATMPQRTRSLKSHEQSPKEIVYTIGNSRYGNIEWLKAMQEVNSKGLMTEYLMMQSEENYIREQTKRLKQRVEAMIATLTSGKLVEYSKKIQALQISAEAGIVPSMIDLQLEASGDEYINGYDDGSTPWTDNGNDICMAIDGHVSQKAAKAAMIATRKAHHSSVERCALYIRRALQGVGYKFTPQASAYMYHTNGVMREMGFDLIATSTVGYKPQIGDVIVYGRTPKHVHGHIQIYNGTQWVSDFRQRTINPYTVPGKVYIYRDQSSATATGKKQINESCTTSGGQNATQNNQTTVPTGKYTDGKNNVTVAMSCQAHPEAARAGVRYYPMPETKQTKSLPAKYRGSKNELVHPDAYIPLTAMIDDAAKDGIKLFVVSGYRSINHQNSIVNNKKKSGQSNEKIYSASTPGGYSEHHTGFAFDFNSLQQSFDKTKEFKWLQANAHKYGFKLTYTNAGNGKAKNGTMYEPWHWTWQGNLTARNALVNSRCP